MIIDGLSMVLSGQLYIYIPHDLAIDLIDLRLLAVLCLYNL